MKNKIYIKIYETLFNLFRLNNLDNNIFQRKILNNLKNFIVYDKELNKETLYILNSLKFF